MEAPQEGGADWLSDEQRRTVRAMAGYGAPRSSIAAYLQIDVPRLNALLGAELDQAEADANTKVAQALFQMATRQNNVAAAIFWMKARAGWREKVEIKAVVDDISRMSDAELRAEIQRLDRELKPIQVITGVTRAEDLTDEEQLRIGAGGPARGGGDWKGCSDGR
jgi:hypothetical protein